MAVIYNGIGERYVPIQRAVSVSNQNPWVLLVKFSPIQQGDIRVRGSVFVFRNLTGTAIGDFFAYEQFRQSNDRAGYIIRWASSTSDLISIVPYYDFPQVVIWTEGAGIA